MSVFCWDFDGTIAYSEHLWSNSVFEALKSELPECFVSFNDIREHMKTGFTWHAPEKDYSLVTGEAWWQFMEDYFCKVYIALGLPSACAQNASKRIRQIIKRPGNYTLYPDAGSTLLSLRRRGHKNIILSNNFPDLEEVIDELGLTDYFENIVVSAKVGYEKPRAEIFDCAKALYPLETRFYMIGDNISADIIGGKNAGMTTLLVHKLCASPADYNFESLSDILSIL